MVLKISHAKLKKTLLNSFFLPYQIADVLHKPEFIY